MNIVRSLKQLTTLTIFSGTLFFASCKKVAPQPAIIEKNSVAYIYKTDNTDSLAYKALLEEDDCHVTLIDKANVTTNNYKSYQLIDNNKDGQLADGTWANAETGALRLSRKPY